MISAQRSLLILAMACTAMAQSQPADVLAKVQDAYMGLTAVHITASRTDTVALRGGSSVVKIDYDLAQAPHGRFRASQRSTTAEELLVSDGSTIWKALPRAKKWSSQQGAALATQDDQEPTEQSDLRDGLSRLLLGRYPALAKIAEEPVILKEETYSLHGAKLPCYVLRTRIKENRFEFWIDKARFLVLRSVQNGLIETPLGKRDGTIDIKVNSIAVDNEVDASVFTFAPEKKWAEVESLVFPDEHHFSWTGRRAADFTLRSLDGEQITLSALRGTVVVIDFWATWCPPCREELPVVEKLRREFTGVRFLGISDEDTDILRRFLKPGKYLFQVLADAKGDVMHRYGIRAIPSIMIVDRNGTVVHHFMGGRSERELREALQSAVKAAADPGGY